MLFAFCATGRRTNAASAARAQNRRSNLGDVRFLNDGGQQGC